ncbi:MAG: HK97 family phage prohead protease [Luminiphilus sp.]
MPRNDYPDGAVNNARRVLAYVEKNGWGSCGTPVGKQRASQLANRENISDETIKRTYSFLSRHAQSADIPYSEGCGGLMYDAWGGKSMLSWARARVNEMNKRDIDGAVRRALRNISRAHNVRNKDNKVTPLALEIAYTNLCGEPKERIQQIKRYLSGQDKEHVRKREAAGVNFRAAELRAAEKPMMLEGYAALYNEETDIGSFREMIAPGAFSDVMDDDVRLLLNHDGAPLARTKNGTLQLSDDEKGLYYRAELIDTQAGRDLYAMVQRGDITQSSFGFTIKEQDIQEGGLRVITKVGRLLDVSPVTYPAYEATEVYARKQGVTEEPTDIEA